MAITYSEFDTTPAGLVAAIKAAILASSDWSDYAVAPVTTTSTNATSSSGSTVNLTSTAGFAVGQYLIVNPGGSEIYRLITNITGLTVTISTTWGAVYNSGTTFKTKNTVLQSTSDEGAKLIVDLEADTNNLSYMGIAVYRDWTSGTSPGGHVDARNYWIYYKTGTSGSTPTMPLHVVLSAGKNHLFFSIEGPRANETGATSTTYGSVRNYFALSELTPYHAADTVPAAIGIGVCTATWNPSVGAGHHQVHISRDSEDTVSWAPGRLATLDWPTIYTTDVVGVNRDCSIDGNTYLLPWVMFSEAEGIRGRLTNFFFAGVTQPSPALDFGEPVGTKVSYNGILYKLIAANKGDAAQNTWGAFGSIANGTTSGPIRSIVLAVPFSAV